MKNTTGLYKHQRDNQGKRRKLPAVARSYKLVPVVTYEYEKARRKEEAPQAPDGTAGEDATRTKASEPAVASPIR